jgi:hypothetical protein
MSLLSWYFGADDDEQTIKATEEKLRYENARDRDKYGDAWYKQTVENDAKDGTIGVRDGTAETFVDDGFKEGFEDGKKSIRDSIGSTVSTLIGTPLSLIPWNVWIILAVVAFFYFGGSSLLKKKS